MVISATLGAYALALVIFGTAASLLALATLADVVVGSRRERVARQESIRTYYHHRMVPTH